ncbi:ankyrin repeat domain-containing protein [Nitrincola iocasae]|uniref:Uncharacterized protein n=1 Tax=Nitrincola iocasae TaxID=2614693 RepID=A0A5J6L9Z1_9GAMM|nr:ankyrin repeat domain-containing protein [Nitrincola iocasae]QEW05343.1 hypothetical protein F5I99_01890 [Nitrincola iocasae]
MGENVAMEGFVGFKVAIKVAILGALFSAMVAAETQYPSFKEYKQIKRDEIQAIIDQHNAKGLPLAEATYTLIDPYRQDSLEYPLIFEAVRYGSLNQLNALIEAGADVNAFFPMRYPRTPIYYAITDYPYGLEVECHPEHVRLLLEAGASIEELPPSTRTLLGNYTAPVEISGCNEILSLLIQAGADVNAQNIGGFTPLFDALTVHDVAGIELLIEAGADPMITDIGGVSVVEYVLQMTLQYLPLDDSGADTIRRFIELAVDKKYEENIEILLE